MKSLRQILIFFGGWEIIVRVFKIESYIVPAPSQIFIKLAESYQIVLKHTIVTLSEAIVGLILAILISVFLAIIIDIKPQREKYIVPYFAVFQTIPIIVIAPILLIWFGFGMFAKILLVVMLCIYPILINLLKGLRSIDQEIIDFWHVIHADELSLYRHVKLPSAIPYFFAGVRLSATYCISGAMFAEYVGAKNGLGIYLSRVLTNFNYELIFGIVIIVSGLTLILLQIIKLIENKVLKHYNLTNHQEVL